MANNAGTLEIIARELGVSIEPLQDELNENFFGKLGLRLPKPLLDHGNWVNEIGKVASSAAKLANLTAELVTAIKDENTELIIQKGKAIIEELIVFIQYVSELVQTLDQLANTVSGLSTAERNEIKAFSAELGKKLIDYLIIRYIEKRSLPTAAMLNFLGIAVKDKVESTSTTVPGHTVYKLELGNLFDFFSDPEQYLKDVYGWGTSSFDAEKFLKKFGSILEAFEMPVSYFTLGGNQQLDAILFSLAENKSGATPSLDYEIRFPGQKTVDIDIPINDIWSAVVSVIAKFAAGLTGELKPPFNVSLSPSGTSEIEASLGIKAKDDSGPMILFGKADSSRLSLQEFNASVGLIVRQSGEFVNAEPVLSANIIGGKLYVDLAEGDGFLQTILSNIKLDGDFELLTKWMPSTGLMLQGSGGLEVEIPTHLDLGVLLINSLVIGIGITPEHPLKTETSASITIKLGPLTGVVERIGANAYFNFPDDRDGNLGPVDLSFGFKPPNGLGLSLDAGIIRGGGYLFFDFDKGEYAGALEFTFSEMVSLKAIGIITTKMPDGSDGFSMLIIITAEFGAGIQLGFGFKLIGVGGLMGLNRTMKLEKLAEGVRDGGINSIMFPQDVVANAQKIISDLKTYFPVEQDKFLIGPMAKIGWGTPTLISVSLGIIIEIPGNIAILGVIKIALPDEDAALLVLQVNFIGAIEFDKERLWFFASMFGSRVLFITIDGEMGLLIAWGNNAEFVCSIGGFHPVFEPPALPFPNPVRLSFNILNESWGKVRVMGYFAVTSNTVQFGARVEIYFGFSVLSVDGHIGFDALFQFSPFYFIISISASFSVKVFGAGIFSVKVQMSLEGPTPWRAKGTGSISILFWDIEVDFDETWGDKENTTLPPVAVMPLIKAELDKIENWKAEPPAGSSLLVSLRQLEEAEELVLHPVGTLKISQRAIPLDITLDKVGAQKPSDANKFHLNTSGSSVDEIADLKENFPLAQFQEMENTEKLSRPSFEQEHSGVEMAAKDNTTNTGKAVKRIIRYETIIIDSHYKRAVIRFFEFFTSLFKHFMKNNAVAKSPLSYKNKKEMIPNDEVITINPNIYSVANMADNKAFSKEALAFESEALAQEYLKSIVNESPDKADSIHVIPQTELNIA